MKSHFLLHQKEVLDPFLAYLTRLKKSFTPEALFTQDKT
jgi:hypothetical protein